MDKHAPDSCTRTDAERIAREFVERSEGSSWTVRASEAPARDELNWARPCIYGFQDPDAVLAGSWVVYVYSLILSFSGTIPNGDSIPLALESLTGWSSGAQASVYGLAWRGRRRAPSARARMTLAKQPAVAPIGFARDPTEPKRCEGYDINDVVLAPGERFAGTPDHQIPGTSSFVLAI